MKDTNKKVKKNVGENPKNENLAFKQDEESYSEPELQIPNNEEFTFADRKVYVDKDSHQLCGIDAKGVPYLISDEVHLKRVSKNLDTQSVKIDLVHVTKWTRCKITVKLEDLPSNKLYGVLSKKGVMIVERCVCTLSDYLFGQVQSYIDRYGYRYEHYRLGWGKKGRSSGFFASNSIDTPYRSSLVGNQDKILGQNGDRTIYDNMVKNEIVPNQSLHLPFVLGFTAPIVPMISKKSDTPVLLVNFSGKSSMGKSTSMKLIASIWGKGIVSNGRLSVCKTFSCTENGFEAAINANHGIPALFDDFQSATKEGYFSQLIYRLTQGESKIRCNKNGRLVDTYSWSTFVGFTGERNIFDYLTEDLGLKARIIQFQNVSWTVSEQNVTNINSVIDENYGFLGEEFVSKVLAKSDDDLAQYYLESKKAINDALPTNETHLKRLQGRLAIIRMTAVLVKELIEPGIDVDYITDFLVENEKKRQLELDIFESAREKLVEYINKNLPNFVRRGVDADYVSIPSTRIVGRIYNGRQGRLVAILPDEFEKIMRTFGDHDLILDRWKEQGFLVVEKGRLHVKQVVISELADKPRCYVFLFKDYGKLFEKLQNLESISIQELEKEDLLAECAENSKGLLIRKPQYQIVKTPVDQVVEKKTRHLSETHEEYTENVTVDDDDYFPGIPVDTTEFNDEEEIEATFEGDDSYEDD